MTAPLQTRAWEMNKVPREVSSCLVLASVSLSTLTLSLHVLGGWLRARICTLT